MTECSFQQRVALHVCGDYPDAEVAAHLEGCRDCRALAAELLADAELLRLPPRVPTLRFRPPTARMWWLRGGAVAAAAAAALVLALLPSPRPELPVHPSAPPVVAVIQPTSPVPVVAAPRPLRRTPAVQREPRHLTLTMNPHGIGGPGSIVIVKQTADPDVVILLVGSDEPTSGTGEQGK